MNRKIYVNSVVSEFLISFNDYLKNILSLGGDDRKIINYHKDLFSQYKTIHVNVNYIEYEFKRLKKRNEDNQEPTQIDYIIYLENISSIIENYYEQIDYKLLIFFSNLYTTKFSLISNNQPDYEEKVTKKDLNTEKENIFKKLENQKKDIFYEINKQSEKLENIQYNVLTNMISIVSIFVAIAFVMFGGMSMMSSLFSNLSELSIPLIELICLGSLLGIIMISAIYAFIIFILRILDKIKMVERQPYKETYKNFVILLTIIFSITFILWLIKTYIK